MLFCPWSIELDQLHYISSGHTGQVTGSDIPSYKSYEQTD